MINIDFSSGKITPKKPGAPGTAVGLKKAGVHLTTGYMSPDKVPAASADPSPLELKGEVDVLVDSKAESDQVLGGPWFFGFIQVARIKEQSASWEGRRDGEGSVDLLVFGFPVSNDIVALDSDPANQPFFSRDSHTGLSRIPQPGQRRVVHVSNTIGDHPNYREFLETANSETKSRNFLHRLIFNIEFTSVFVGRDGNGPIQPIAHIKWTVNLAGELKWTGGKPKAVRRPSQFEVGLSVPGAPSDPDVQAIVANPGPPLAKGIAIERWKEALQNPRMRQESSKRSLLLPRDFFT